MDIEEVLNWTDRQVFVTTGKHLDSLQKSILEGIWLHQDYEKIAANHHRSYDHVKKEAWKLWKLLSETLEEDIKQSNVRSILEGRAASSIYNFGKNAHLNNSLNNIHSSHVSICGDKRQSSDDDKDGSPSPPDSPPHQSQSPAIALTDAPELTTYYDRTAEISTLKQWILEARTHAIALYGLSGIGKSALALKLIEEIQSDFDYIIWRSLGNAPALSTLQTELKQFFSPSQPTPLPAVIDYFRASRCLVILDDVQNIFQPGELAGEYLAGCEDYGKFFKQVAASHHQSCLLLLSWEKPRDIAALEGENHSVRTLHLQGLAEAAAEIFRDKELADEEKWSDLIALYQGHPSWLTITASTIVELFDGSVSLFLDDKDNIFLGDLEPFLESHLQRLSELEVKVCGWLASQAEGVDISQKPGDRDFSKSELWQAIKSLGRRGLVEKVQFGGRSHFLLNPVFQQYIQSNNTRASSARSPNYSQLPTSIKADQ